MNCWWLCASILLFSTNNKNANGQTVVEKCNKWKNNLTDITDEPQHKYVILEECLYYSLLEQSDKQLDKPNSLVVYPPTQNEGDLIVIQVKQLNVRQLWMNEAWKEMQVSGHMDLGWKDYRMKWDITKWKQMSTLTIKSFGHLWLPDLYSGRSGTVGQNGDFSIFKDIEAKNNGDISAKLDFRMQALCEVNYDEFPNDRQYCCFYIHSQLFSKIIRFNVTNHIGIQDPTTIQTNWKIRSITVDNENANLMKTCIVTTRKSSTLQIELTLPVVISAILVVVAPLFGSFRAQMYVKLFALLLQFLCFQFLVNRTPQLGVGEVVPKIYKFYEFTLAMTMVSLFCTLITSAISRVKRALPPPHKINLVVNVVNTYLCCYDRTEDSSEANGKTDAISDYTSDWRDVFVCINNLFSLIILIAYIIGVLVLCT